MRCDVVTPVDGQTITAGIVPNTFDSKETTMKLSFLIAAVCCCALTFGQEPLTSAPEIPYEAVPNLLKLPPDLHLGEVAGVAVNSKGHVFVYSRTGERSTVHGATAARIRMVFGLRISFVICPFSSSDSTFSIGMTAFAQSGSGSPVSTYCACASTALTSSR